jgi:hypothetical protein
MTLRWQKHDARKSTSSFTGMRTSVRTYPSARKVACVHSTCVGETYPRTSQRDRRGRRTYQQDLEECTGVWRRHVAALCHVRRLLQKH